MFPNITHRLPSQHNRSFLHPPPYPETILRRRWPSDLWKLLLDLRSGVNIQCHGHYVHAQSFGRWTQRLRHSIRFSKSSILLPKMGRCHRSTYVAINRLRQVQFLSFVQRLIDQMPHLIMYCWIVVAFHVVVSTYAVSAPVLACAHCYSSQAGK
jgi:hypothetical protein